MLSPKSMRRASCRPITRALRVMTAYWILRECIVKAYPIRILNWHQVVNDRFGDEPSPYLLPLGRHRRCVRGTRRGPRDDVRRLRPALQINNRLLRRFD